MEKIILNLQPHEVTVVAMAIFYIHTYVLIRATRFAGCLWATVLYCLTVSMLRTTIEALGAPYVCICGILPFVLAILYDVFTMESNEYEIRELFK